jgi:hypothetical protein
MSVPINRRRFVTGSLAAAAAAGLADFGFLNTLPALAADEAKANPKTVQLSPDIEPLVRLIEDTDREKLLEAVAARIKDGVSYQQLLSAVMLAGVRGIKPRPVGFQFHAVLVINSANLASMAATDKDRWLPLFWALDNFKSSQATNKKSNDGWMMPPVEEAKLAPETEARKRFIAAMDDWDEEGSDRAVVPLARTGSSGEVYELFWRYGARDFRDIGHKAIYVANSWRTLQTIGWRHAEPVLRSLVSALLEHKGDNPAKGDDVADRPWRENIKRAADFGPNWRTGKVSPEATADFLAALRTANESESCDKVVEMVKKGVSPDSLWDGLFLMAGELIARQPGIVGIHCVTSTNALHFAYQTTANDETRRMMLLQCAAFLALFRKQMSSGGKLPDLKLDGLEKTDAKQDVVEAVEEIFNDLKSDMKLAARRTLALVADHPERAEPLMAAARRLLFTKGRDSHDYKFSSAALEDYYAVSPRYAPYYLASSMFNLKGTGHPDNDLIKRTRAALGKA